MATLPSQPPGVARDRGESVQDILKRDSRPVPDVLTHESYRFLGDEDLSVDRYISREFFDLEMQKLWPKVWQMACREEDIPEIGDYIIYDIGPKSLIVTRTDSGIRAYHNSCLHRGRRLATEDGAVDQFRCPFHGFTWDLEGRLKDMPCDWDFPHLKARDMTLPQALVGLWGGFVFINMDLHAEPLADFLHPLPDHFANWPIEDTYKAVHVGKVIPANWKVTAEAFMEAYHVLATHPQIMPYAADSNTQYDIYGDYVNRHFNVMGEPSPHLQAEPLSSADIVAAAVGSSGRIDSADVQVPEGMSARQFLAEANRRRFAEMDGHDYASRSDAEMVDALVYNVFPNFSPWGGLSGIITYRWRPWAMAVDKTLMEVMILMRVPKQGPRPAPAPMHFLDEAASWHDAPELGALCDIFEQDMDNIPHVQTGLMASAKGAISLGNYQEVRIRQFHQTLDKYLSA